LQPEERVQAFIDDFQVAHQKWWSTRSRVKSEWSAEYARWKQLVAELDAAHFIDGGGRRLETVLENPSPHKGEKITGRTLATDRVVVQTHTFTHVDRYFEYEQREVNGDWRIVRIREFRETADASLSHRWGSGFPLAGIPPRSPSPSSASPPCGSCFLPTR